MVPMLPVTHGNEFTRLQVFLYTLVLFAGTLLPFVQQLLRLGDLAGEAVDLLGEARGLGGGEVTATQGVDG